MKNIVFYWRLSTSGARLYSLHELEKILQKRDMDIVKTFSNYYGKPATPKEMQLLVYSTKLT